MPKKMKVYLPSWVRWVVLAALTLIWSTVTYMTFGRPEGREDLGVVGWLLFTVVALLIGVMIWLMASGRLPAYIIEVEDDEDGSP